VSVATRTVAAFAAGMLVLSACTGTGSDGGASPGITKDRITVRNIASLTGPVPGVFQGAPYGVEAYFAYINSQGGVHGRQLELRSVDDALNCTQNRTATNSLANSTFALVGSFSVFDDCGAAVLTRHPDLPDVSYGFGPALKKLPNHFSALPAPPGWPLGTLTYLKQEYGALRMGVLAGQGGQVQVLNAYLAAARSLGYTIAYQRQFGATETTFTTDILRMRRAGVDFLDVTQANAATIARILVEAAQQGWRPKVINAAAAYDSKFLSLLGGNTAVAEGVLMPNQFAMMYGEDEATTPGVSTFLTALKKVRPSFAPDLFTVFGWVHAQLFVEALRAAGPNPTRRGLLDALRAIHEFDAGGLIAPSDPGAGKPATCWMLAQVRGGRFVRVLPPDKGFVCEPGGYFNYTG